MTDFGNWLDGQRGRTKWLADVFGITHAAVNQWRVSGIPKERLHDVRMLTNIPYEDLIDPFLPDRRKPLLKPVRKVVKANGKTPHRKLRKK